VTVYHNNLDVLCEYSTSRYLPDSNILQSSESNTEYSTQPYSEDLSLCQ